MDAVPQMTTRAPTARRRMTESLMMSPAALGLTARDIADLVAFLRVR